MLTQYCELNWPSRTVVSCQSSLPAITVMVARLNFASKLYILISINMIKCTLTHYIIFWVLLQRNIVSMRGSRKFCQKGVQFWQRLFFYLFWMRGERIQIALKAGQHQRHFRWSAKNGPTLNAGLVALWFFRGSEPVMPRNPIICDFSGGGVGPPVPPLDPRMQLGFLQNHEAHIKSHPTTSQTMIAL